MGGVSYETPPELGVGVGLRYRGKTKDEWSKDELWYEVAVPNLHSRRVYYGRKERNERRLRYMRHTREERRMRWLQTFALWAFGPPIVLTLLGLCWKAAVAVVLM